MSGEDAMTPHEERVQMRATLERLRDWVRAYDVPPFGEVDLAECRKLLGERDFTNLHASWARLLMTRVAALIDEGLVPDADRPAGSRYNLDAPRAVVVAGPAQAEEARLAFPGHAVIWPGVGLTGRRYEEIAVLARIEPGGPEDRWLQEQVRTRLPAGAELRVFVPG